MQRSAIILLAVAIVTLFSYSEGTIGLDLSFWQGDVPQSSWNCLRSNGYSFAIVQVWKESGSLNQHAADGIKRAWAAGFAHVDAYLFPRFGMDGGVQVRDSVNFLRNNGAKFGMLWIDIEDRAEWGNCDQNIALLRQIVQVSQQMGVNVGIYASATQWSSIMCGRTGFQNLPLWYPHYDGNPSFSDFRAFGGWSKPAIKQYRGSFGICGTTIDASFY